MKRVCFITGSRAEYGILSPIMKEIQNRDDTELQVIACHEHFSQKHGKTVKEIESDGFKIDAAIDSMSELDSPSGVVNSMADLQKGLAEAFTRLKPDIIVILGDRYEMLAAASTAVIFHIPIAHIHGGEITEGAIDEFIRHAITKLSSLHFAATKEYSERIVRMGENPSFVFNVGSPSIDDIPNEKILDLREFEDSIGFKTKKGFILVTYHPETLSEDFGIEQIKNLTEVLEDYISEDYTVLITLPNSDRGTNAITEQILRWSLKWPDNVKVVTSLGRKRFHSALKNCSLFAGNSSAGLIEAPFFRVPAINIGDRQKGRAMGPTVINVTADKDSITDGFKKAFSKKFRDMIETLSIEEANPYYKKGSVKEIAKRIAETIIPSTKPFYDGI